MSVSTEKNDWDDEDDANNIIDISSLNIDNEEIWLVMPNTSPSKWNNIDIRSWLKENTNNDDKCKSIDTRTWTRPKKRFSRLSFNGILESSSSSSSSSPSTCEKPLHNYKPIKSVFEQIDMNIIEKNDKIPLMFKPLIPCDINLIGNTVNQESLEAFVNLSQANGVDSFINMQVPELSELATNHNCNIMNNNNNIDCQFTQFIHEPNKMIDSQILTDSMMQTSIFNDATASDIGFTDKSTLKNTCTSLNETMIDKVIHNNTFDIAKEKKKYPIFSINNDIISCSANYSSYIVDKSNQVSEQTENEKQNLNETSNFNNVKSTNLSYNNLEMNNSVDQIFDSTFVSNNIINIKPTLSSSFIIKPLNSTFLTKENIDFNGSITKENNSLAVNKTYDNDVLINHTYVNIPSPSSFTPISESRKTRTIITATEIGSIATSTPLLINNNNNFKKDEEIETSNNQVNCEYEKMKNKTINRYHTYRKNKDNNDTENIGLDNKIDINLTNKNTIKSKLKQNILQSKRNTLSRLPQTFQKSNPNLTFNSNKNNTKLSLKLGSKQQDKIINKNKDLSVVNKLYSSSSSSLLKIKNESEIKKNDNILGTCYKKIKGSTESIESTQSAPDLDDRSASSNINNHQLATKIDDNGQMLKYNFMSCRNLPSPIMKDDQSIEMCANPPSIKSSSPIISSSESLQSLNINNDQFDKPPEPKKTALEKMKIPKGRGIVPPTIRSSSNSNSGIPRPTSRIPAPKFSTSRVKSQIGK